MSFRVGFGYDVHRLEKGHNLVLGGIKIQHEKGLIAHSDGDVLIHSICDALLGAANLRDIGYHFPDNSNKFKDIDSKVLLKNTIDFLSKKGFEVVNTDSTIAMQQPKLKDHIQSMQVTLSEIMGISIDVVSIKATTTEKMGFEGREEGVSAYSVCLISKK